MNGQTPSKEFSLPAERLEEDIVFWKCIEAQSFQRGTMDALSSTQIIEGVVRGVGMQEATAKDMANRLYKQGYFIAVMRKKGAGEISRTELQDGVFYRARLEEDPRCLNSQCRSEVGDAVELAGRLKDIMTRMTGEFITDNGINFKGMKESPAWYQYRLLAAQLQKSTLNPSSLSSDERLAFFLNLYNCLVMDATMRIGAPKNALARSSFFKTITYIVAGEKYSMDDIEHGIIRANSPHAGGRKPQLKKSDPRAQLAVTKLDPRVHFALNCGARSCPPIRVYNGKNVEKALQFATENFVRDNVTWNPGKGTLEVSKIFMWYKGDFGSSDAEVIAFIRKFMDPTDPFLLIPSSTKVKLVYAEYDWSTNSDESSVKVFNAFIPVRWLQ